MYIYHKNRGYYVSVQVSTLKTYVARIFKSTNISLARDHKYVKNVVENLLLEDDLVLEGDAKFDKGYIAFSNGVLNLQTMELMCYSPSIFLSCGLPFPYIPTLECPKFLSYLNDFCMGEEDRIQFMRSFMSAILHQRTDFQVFLYMFGPGG